MFYVSQKEFQTFSFEEKLDTELKNKILNYFSIWSGFDILSQEDKKYILELLNNSKAPSSYTSKVKSKFNLKSDDEFTTFLKNNEIYKVTLTQIQQKINE